MPTGWTYTPLFEADPVEVIGGRKRNKAKARAARKARRRNRR